MKYFIVFVLIFLTFSNNKAQNFDDYFTDKTLRIDYIFSGTETTQDIALKQLYELPYWSGRKNNLDQLLLSGNGQISVIDVNSGKVIYKDAFSSLFQEWQTTEEAKNVKRCFENTYLIPFPKNKIAVEISLRDKAGNYIPYIKHTIDPNDILIKKIGFENIPSFTYTHKTKGEKAINIAILAEGFTEGEMPQFRAYATIATEQILAHTPFNRYKDKLNFVAVETISKNSGVSVPSENIWKETAFNSHFDTFYSDRYLTSSNVTDIHDAIAGIPYSHIIILANTNVYGGGGIYNAYTLTSTGHEEFESVVVHEFGHSFGGLADEYYYESGDVLDQTYKSDIEPWEANLTTLVSFKGKWENLLLPNTPIPTNKDLSEKYPVGVYEGGGYQVKGIYRCSTDCRMKTNICKDFCPACQKALEKLINFYTE